MTPPRNVAAIRDPAVATVVAAITALWQPFVRAVAAELAAELASGRIDVEIDQRSVAALKELRISPRMYLEAARASEFRSTKRGRLIVARRGDVEAWLERRSLPAEVVEREAETETSLDDQIRAELGLRRKPSTKPHVATGALRKNGHKAAAGVR